MPAKKDTKAAAPKAEKAAKSPKKAAKAPKADKVKRAPSAFIIFSQDRREAVKKANPNATFGELGKLLGAEWGALDEKAKAVSNLFPTNQSCSLLTYACYLLQNYRNTTPLPPPRRLPSLKASECFSLVDS